MSREVNLRNFLVGCNGLTSIERKMGRLAAREALKSKDTTKVGAVIYRDNVVLSTGYNHFVCDVENIPMDVTEHNKSKFTIHGEMQAIIEKSKTCDSLYGATIIVVGKCPCTDCAKAIVASGIGEVICPPQDSNSRWTSENDIALKILKASGVQVRIQEELAGVSIGLTCPTKYIV